MLACPVCGQESTGNCCAPTPQPIPAPRLETCGHCGVIRKWDEVCCDGPGVPPPTTEDYELLGDLEELYSRSPGFDVLLVEPLIRRCFDAERDRDHYKTQMEHSAEEYEAAVRELNEALERVKELEAELERSYEQGSRMIQAAARCMALGHFPRSVFITKEQWAESHHRVESQERTKEGA